jgi:hypothetical protein
MRLLFAIGVVAVAAEVMGCKSSQAVSRNETARAISQIDDAARVAGLADEENCPSPKALHRQVRALSQILRSCEVQRCGMAFLDD